METVYLRGLIANVTLLVQDSVDDKERSKYEQLIETIGRFFFDQFLLGYVENCNSFRFPGGMQWAVYVEVSLDNILGEVINKPTNFIFPPLPPTLQVLSPPTLQVPSPPTLQVPSPPTLQVPSRDQMTPDESLREFFPALGLLCTPPHTVSTHSPPTWWMLTCKYLKAYRLGGTKGIDRLYRESRLQEFSPQGGMVTTVTVTLYCTISCNDLLGRAC